MNEVELKIRKIIEYSDYFSKLKNDDSFLYDELNKISIKTINMVKDYYKNSEKIKKIRYLIIKEIEKEELFTKEKLENIKESVNKEYSTNILQSWKEDFSIVHTIFYMPIKDEVETLLVEIGVSIINGLNLNNVELKKQGFDSGQNFGSDICWIAIYNNKQKNQSTSLQLFIEFNKDNLIYGLFEFLSKNQFKSKFEQTKEQISFEMILNDLKNNVDDIIKDTEYVPKFWKFSPGENAKYWDEMKFKGIASIGWGNLDFVDKTAKKIKELDINYFKKDSKSPAIIEYINKIMIGDYLIAFNGETNILGYGVVTNGAQYSEEEVIKNTDNYNFLSVKWFEFKEPQKSKKVHRNTFVDVNDRKEEFNNLINNNKSSEIINKYDGENMPTVIVQKQPLNQILYGSPGTGKTYHTIDKALEIIFKREDKNKEFNFKIKDKNGKEIEPTKKTYNDILNSEEVEKRIHLKGLFEYFKDEENGQIEFVTFHQSYGYEEFVEGIKAKTNEETKNIEYEIEAGIFKKLSEKAKEITYKKDSIEFDSNSKIWKISLAGSGDNKIKTECYKDGYIRFSYEEKFNESVLDNRELNIPLNALVNKMKIGDIVVSLDTYKSINQIGIVESEYLYLEEYEKYRHARKVKWFLTEPKIIDFYEINGNIPFANSAIHEINPNKEKFFNLIPNQDIEVKANNVNKNYILIIDEINRGNISKIFGELITLIEPSKRIGADEEIRVKLPYSGKEFGVPLNLYIIGTMNTADRSIAPIDTALRRRFIFEEMAPDSSLLNKEKIIVQVSKNDKSDTGIELDKLLEAINIRIEYLYDRDHTLGHAYLIDVKTFDDLKFAFKNMIIPLLAEYFYEDWENIDLVLNQNGFIINGLTDENYLTKIKSKINGKTIFKVSVDKYWDVENFKKIYDDTIDLRQKDETTTNKIQSDEKE